MLGGNGGAGTLRSRVVRARSSQGKKSGRLDWSCAGPMVSGIVSTRPPRGVSDSFALRERVERRTAAVRRVPSARVNSPVAGRS